MMTKHTTAAPHSASVVSLDTIHSETWHLVHLLDATVDYLQELDFVRNEEGYCPLDRLAALSWIARDHAERIAKDIDNSFHSIVRGAAQ